MSAPDTLDAPPTAFDGFEHGRVATVGPGIHYRAAGAGDPVMLVHGWPQHSLMWHSIAPALAERHRVICPDLRGAGGSGIAADGYDKTTMAGDLVGLADALGLERFALVGYDLGAGVAAALARDHPDRVERLAVAEFGLAGFGYETMMTPDESWTIDSNWHLSLFTVPDAAMMLCAGRERELLAWFFQHISFAGQDAVSHEHFERYVRELSKPGALRAGIAYYASVWQDARDNARLADAPLSMPVLALGGEASSGPALEMIWSSVATDLQTFVIPRAGHWIGDENPAAVADRLLDFLGDSRTGAAGAAA